MAEETKLPGPVRNPETERFFEAATEGKLLIKSCNGCGENFFYPRALCPFCFSDDTQWVETKGQGEVYSFVIVHMGGDPYVIAYVTLDEGPTIFTNLVDMDFDQIQIGDRVTLKFLETDSDPIPVFTAAGA